MEIYKGSETESGKFVIIFILFYFFISWRLITLQYCSGFRHTLKWISHGFTCVPHPNPPSHLPLYLIPLGLPSASGRSTCLMHPTWAGDLFHPRYYTCFDADLPKHPTLAFSHRVQKSVLYICVSFSVLHLGLSLPSFKISYICVSILYWCFSFWLTSLFSFFFNTVELQKIEMSELPLPLRSPGSVQGKEEGVALSR